MNPPIALTPAVLAESSSSRLAPEIGELLVRFGRLPSKYVKNVTNPNTLIIRNTGAILILRKPRFVQDGVN